MLPGPATRSPPKKYELQSLTVSRRARWREAATAVTANLAKTDPDVTVADLPIPVITQVK